MATLLRRIEIPLALTNGNDGRGNKWFRSSNVRTKIEKMLRQLGHATDKPFGYPVKLKIIRVLGPKQSLWDSDSIGRGNSKELIDALVAIGWLVDDGPKYVKETHFSQHVPKPRRKACVVVEVLSVDGWK